MKLAELSDIRKGIKLDARILVNAKPAKGAYYAYLEAENFTKNVIGKFVAEKELKRLKLYSNSIFLNYGDYLVYKHNNRFKIIRYEQISGQTVPSETLIVISSNYSIVGEFLGYEKNRKYFCEAIEKWLLGNSNASEIEVISNVEVMTDNIREIEGPNFSEQIGIRKPLDSKELPIKIVDKAISLDKLIKRIEHGELILDTEFQRKSGLWDLETKSRFIESLIVSVPVPAFYFDGDDDDKWLVIDGVQRLSTVSTFLKDAFELTALDYLSKDLEGKKFSDLGRAYQRKIEEYQVFAYILQKGTPQSVKYKIFKNINTSALILTPQEIRHAINPNKPAPFLKKIVEMEWFIQYVPMSLKKERMYDRENAPLVNLGTLQDVRYEYAQNSEALSIGFEDNEGFILQFNSKPYDSVNKGLSTIVGSLKTNFTDLDTIPLFSTAFQYLGADRISPQEDYPRFGSNDEILDDDGKLIAAFLGKDGAFTAHYLEKYGSKPITIKSLKHERTQGDDDRLIGQVNYWMQDISPNIDIQAKESRHTNRIELSYRYRTDSGIMTQDRKPQNVGYGITPTLPILVAILAAKPGDIIIIENPETHIHPKGQTRLAMLISKAAEAGVQFLIESHSDHILNGIRVASKKKMIDAEKVRINFFTHSTNQTTTIERLHLDNNGRIDAWPKGFFDEWDNMLDELL